MALVRLTSTLKKALYPPSFRLLAVQHRYIVSTTPRSDQNEDADGGLNQEQQEDESSSSQKAMPPPVKARPYSEELREIMAAKYLSNQPLAKPHALYSKAPSEKLSLQDLRVQYKQRVSSVRKQYQAEMERRKAAKATHDKKQREQLQLAKEARLRLKKERSAQRALEVEEEKRVLQEQLAKERAERQVYRKLMDLKVEDRRQRKRDVIRQQSGTWVNEKDLEERIVEAIARPMNL